MAEEVEKPLSEKEIWDDSTLQNSWNDALQEYNKYHSIHARGEKVEDVLREFENGATNAENSPANEIDMKDEAKDNNNVLASSPAAESSSNIQSSEKDKAVGSSSKGNAPEGMPPVSEHLIGTVHDEDLKKLLLSWYYSGYYTGLYEGKQAARLANP